MDSMAKRTTRRSTPAQQRSPARPSTLPVYGALWEINQAFEVALTTLMALVQDKQVSGRQMQPFQDMVREARAALNSHLTSLLETRETNLAGQLFRRRQAHTE
ncbi:MAG: hypothetical protein JO110_00945 [Acetobacteraceae bacterium]|nr:hypothetical protein [Acetobacteraceae bacterium]